VFLTRSLDGGQSAMEGALPKKGVYKDDFKTMKIGDPGLY